MFLFRVPRQTPYILGRLVRDISPTNPGRNMSNKNDEKIAEEIDEVLNELKDYTSQDGASKDLREITEALSSLPYTSSALEVEEETTEYLSEKCKNDMKNKSRGTVGLQNGLGSQAVYFGVKVKKENKNEMVKELSKIANELSDRGLISSVLAPISSIELARVSMEAPSVIVLFFPLVPFDYYHEIKEKYDELYMEEGSIPAAFEDLSAPLGEGEFFATIRISNLRTFLNPDNHPSTEQILQEALKQEIQAYLNVLPRGTVVKETNRCNITDMSVPFEVKFYHPYMKSVKYVDLDYVRHCERFSEGLTQFNVLVGVRYYGHKNQRLFHGE